jgi:cation:H+ antiporter
MGDWLTYVLMAVGFVVLIKGSDLLVDGASAIAKGVGISDLIVGMTIVAFGTSLPELVVNVFAATKGQTDLAIGNILGSCIANILLILGVTAMIHPVKATRGTIWKEIPFCLLAAVMVAILPNDQLIEGGVVASSITRTDGLVLLAFLSVFLFYAFELARGQVASTDPQLREPTPLGKPMLLVVLGCVGLFLGGKWTVDGAKALATAFGVGEDLIGLTIVAIGTSAPELATSAVAALKKNTDIAVGNVVGSNIFNIFLVLGVTGVITPIALPANVTLDIMMTIVATLILFFSMFVGAERHSINRIEGGFFLTIYVGFIVYRAFFAG